MDIPDNLLIEEAKNKNEDAIVELINRCEYLIKQIIKKYIEKAKYLGLDYEDLKLQAIYSLLLCIESFDEKREVSFKTYAYKVIKNELNDLIVSKNSYKYQLLNQSYSLDEMKENYEKNLYDKINNNELNPLEKNIIFETNSEIKKKLTSYECKIYELKSEGKTNKEISKILSCPIKKIENACYRIKNKLKVIKYNL